jgi:hypothetical protein
VAEKHARLAVVKTAETVESVMEIEDSSITTIILPFVM